MFATVGNGPLFVYWQNVPGATKYDVEYRSNGGSWHSAASNHTSAGITISGIDYTKAYLVRVRAGNGNGWSGWKNSNPTAPWTTERTVSTPIDDDSKKKLEDAQNAARKTQPGLNHGQASPDPTAATYMSVSSVASSSATLTLHHYDGAWSYKEASGGCVNKSSGTTEVNLAGLNSEADYSYTAYPGSGCTRDSMAFADFTTLPTPYVTNLHTVSNPNPGSTISSTIKQGVAFTTGPKSGGYTLSSVTISMKKSGSTTPGNLVITLHGMEGTNPYNNFSSYPSSTTQATLTGTAPTSTSYADTTFTCSGSGCALSASTTYFVVASYTGSGEYQWRYFGEDIQSRQPSDNGWKIERSHQKNGESPWSSWGDWHMVRVDFR